MRDVPCEPFDSLGVLMKILCVDDETLVLGLVVSMCRELPQKPEVVGFSRSGDALQWLKTNAPEIALLDINMADFNGLHLAAMIKQRSPNTSIIFLTGYSEYAVDAFELRAAGYLLKPVSLERLAREVDYALSCRPIRKEAPHIWVRTFGEFDLSVDGKPVSFPRSRAKEVLAYLVDRHGGSVTRAQIFAALWEDVPYDRPMQKQFDVVIRSLRSTLARFGISDILELNGGSLRIVPERIDCDMYRFFQGDVDAINSFRGEYMNAYPWARMSESYLERFEQNDNFGDTEQKNGSQRKHRRIGS